MKKLAEDLSGPRSLILKLRIIYSQRNFKAISFPSPYEKHSLEEKQAVIFNPVMKITFLSISANASPQHPCPQQTF